MKDEDYIAEAREQEQSETDASRAATADEAPREKPVVRAKSVYEALVTACGTHSRLYGATGRHADMVVFNLVDKSAYVGSLYLVKYGRLCANVIETASVRVEVDGDRWLTDDERMIDPVSLYTDHWHSVEDGGSRFRRCNFPAKPTDEMSDDEIRRGMCRAEARVRLEAWILCAGIDGTLLNYVLAASGKTQASELGWYFSPRGKSAREDDALVIPRAWWTGRRRAFDLRSDNGRTRIMDGDRVIADVQDDVDQSDVRALCAAPLLADLLREFKRTAFSHAVLTGDRKFDHIIREAETALLYIETNRKQEKKDK